MLLRKHTEWRSERVQTVPRVIVEPELDVPADYERRITILIPADPGVQIALDEKPESIDARDEYWPTPPRDKLLRFTLKARQWVVARAAIEMSELSVIIEYLQPEVI